MNCEICKSEMKLLLFSHYCPKCDGKEKKLPGLFVGDNLNCFGSPPKRISDLEFVQQHRHYNYKSPPFITSVLSKNGFIDVEHGEKNCTRPPSETFECDRCHNVVCWCFGGSEDDLCNNCWCEVEGIEE